MRIDISVSKKIGVGRSEIDIKIIGIARSLFITGNGTSNCRLLKIVLSAMATVDIIGQIRGSKTMIDVSMNRFGGEYQFIIGWGQA